MNKNIVILTVLLTFFLTGYLIFTFFFNKTNNISEKKETINREEFVQKAVDKRASFAIFTNGIFRIFTASMYHNLSSDVYIEKSNPNIIIVKKESVTWNDFFSTLPFKLTHNCLTTGTNETFCSTNNKTLKFYLNGLEKAQVLDEKINNGDMLLISFGNEQIDIIRAQLEKVPKLTK